MKFVVPSRWLKTTLGADALVSGAVALLHLLAADALAAWLALPRALLLGSCLLVLAVELLNSAIEALIERYGPEHHELAGRAKDMGSAAVFVTMLNVLAVWGLILLPRLL